MAACYDNDVNDITAPRVHGTKNCTVGYEQLISSNDNADQVQRMQTLLDAL